MKTALITGASSGIGKAFASYYANQGYGLILVSNQPSQLDEVKKQLMNKTHDIVCIAMDLSVVDAGAHLYQMVQLYTTHIDVLVNAAGVGLKGRYLQASLKEIHQLIYLHIVTITDLTYCILKDMVNKNEGTIINISSVSAYNPSPYNAVYAAAKNYVLWLTAAIREDYCCMSYGNKNKFL